MSSSHHIKNTHNPSFIFVEASAKDYSFLNTLAKDPFYQYAKSKEVFHDETGKSNVYNFMIYNEDKQFVGYIKGFYPVYYTHMWIQTLIIHKSFSRQGLGTFSVKTFINTIQSIGPVDKIYLTCHQKNKLGIDFWQSLGFTKARRNIKSTNDLYETSTRSLLCNPKFLKP